jgi:hypothetical protein
MEATDRDKKKHKRLTSQSPETYLGVAIQITDDVVASEAKQSTD